MIVMTRLFVVAMLLAVAPAWAQAPAPAPAPATAPALPKAGTVLRDCPECPEVVVVPPGIFILGSPKGEKHEQPTKPVRITKPFAIGKYEVTFAEWEACVREVGCGQVPNDHDWGKGRRPVINVEFETAKQYTRWLSKKTGRVYRLPSEAEWEYPARAGTTSEYPWGDTMEPNRTNCRECGSEWSGEKSAPVGSFPPNAWGLHDFNGNVWEWTEDCWNPDHAGAPGDARPRTSGECHFRVMRGGSWYYFGRLSRSSYRFKNAAEVKSYNIGFRVVREIP
jgi:formylglycine-generating enzyme required for sulfatase activity